MIIRKRYVVLGAALAVVAVGGSLVSGSAQDQWRQTAHGIFSPVLRMGRGIYDFFTQVDEGLQTLETAQKEVTALRAENSRLSAENSLLRDLVKENARLREMLGFKEQSPYRLVPCRMVAREPSSWWNTIKVDRGWGDDPDLKSDLPVVSPRGVVGKTGTVARHVTEVILLVDENCKVACQIENTRTPGILIGSGDWNRGRPQSRMKFITPTATLAVGERVFTSGLGGVFPAGLPLGSVAEVPLLDPNVNFGLYREAVIEPAADMTQIDELYIITGGAAPGSRKQP